jgi:hypothetical protein
MDLEETETRNDCAGEGQQQFNRPTDLKSLSQPSATQIVLHTMIYSPRLSFPKIFVFEESV